VCLHAQQGDIANEAVAGGAAGLASVRVLDGGDIDAAKPIKEGLTAEQVGYFRPSNQGSVADIAGGTLMRPSPSRKA